MRKPRIGQTWLASALLLGLVALPAGAQDAPPGQLHLAGYLEDLGGVPVVRPVTLRFALYEAAEGGLPLWEEIHRGVLPEQGRFSVYLGSGEDPPTPLVPDLFRHGPRYLGVHVDQGEELRPRQLIAGAAYALFAAEAGHAEVCDDARNLAGQEPDAFAPADHVHPAGAGSGLDADTLDGLELDDLLAAATAQCQQALQLPADGLSQVSNRTLSNEFDAQAEYQGEPQPIFDDEGRWGGKTVELTVGPERDEAIRSLEVEVGIDHPHPTDLQVTLTGPDSVTTLRLHDQGPGGADGLHLRYPRDAPPAGGNLDRFHGLIPAGTWTLNVKDLVADQNGQPDAQTGTIRRFALHFRYLADDRVGVQGDVEVHGRLVAAGVDVLGSLVPVGAVISWWGNEEEVPSGWKLCDGTPVEDPASPLHGQNVPDLRERFVRGATGNVREQAGPEGDDWRTLTERELPSHTHGVNDPGHRHDRSHGGYTQVQLRSVDHFASSNGSLPDWPPPLVQTNITIQPTGQGQPFSVVPAHVGLLFIMRIR